MSKVYEQRPNIVAVVMTDETGSHVRHIVGFTLEEVLESVQLSLDGAEQTARLTPVKKVRKARRTKAEMLKEGRDDAGVAADGIEPKVPATAWP